MPRFRRAGFPPLAIGKRVRAEPALDSITELTVNNKFAALPRSPLQIAAAQRLPVCGDGDGKHHEDGRIDRSCRRSQYARLVVFPEKFLSGYEPGLIAGDPAQYAFELADARLDPIREICRRRGIAAIVGAATRGADGLRISSLVFDCRGEDASAVSQAVSI